MCMVTKKCRCLCAFCTARCACYLEAIDDVLPKNVAAGTYGAQRCEVRVRHPNGESCVLLPKGLSAFDFYAVTSPDATPYGKLYDANDEASCGHDEQEREACVGMHDMLDGCACDEGERYCPDVERKVFDANNAAMEARSIVFDDVCKQHGHDEHKEHLV